MINDPTAQSLGTAPRGAAYVNGELLQGVTRLDCDNNNYFQADTFRVELALSAQPANRDFTFWASLEKADIEILFGFPANPGSFVKSDLMSFLTGTVDDIEIDPVADRITLAGRDLTSLLLDARQTLANVQTNLPASDVITKIANQVGLTPVVTKTNSPVGVYQNIVHALLEQKATYWDLATKLAQIEGFQIYVKGRELHFEPRALPDSDPYVIRYTKQATSGAFELNATRLTFSRNLTVAKDISVQVMSWNSKKNQVVIGKAQLQRNFNKVTRGVAKLDGKPQQYFYAVPNLSSQEADRRAQKILESLSRHEMNLTAELPGDVLLTPRNAVRVEGTGTPFDQVYFADSIRRTFSFDEGFRMTLIGKNQSPNNPPG